MTYALGYAHFTSTSRPVRRLVQTLALSAAAAALLVTSSTTAMAAGDSVSTVANVGVNAAIALTGLTPSFELDGAPGATVSLANAVTMNVVTNNTAGYAVTVLAENDVLTPADPVANPDTIPIANLKVRESGTTTYTSVDDTTPVTVHSQGGKSVAVGDTITNDYQVVIPFVNSDLYSVTLDYVATTL